jgi:hypothetical protein
MNGAIEIMDHEASYGAIPTTEDPLDKAGNEEDRTNRKLRKLRQWSLIAGVCYLITIICGMAAELGIRGNLFDFSSPSATAENIRQNPALLRQGLVLDIIRSCAEIIVSILFGFILVEAGANPVLSLSSVAFRFLQQAVIACNMLHMFAASLLLDLSLNPPFPAASAIDALAIYNNNDGTRSGDAAAGTDPAESLAFLFLLLHKYGKFLALVFWGVSMILLGAVILMHGVFPRWLGGIIALAGIGCILDSSLYLLGTGYNGEATALLMLPALVSELGLTGWLLFGTPSLANDVFFKKEN